MFDEFRIQIGRKLGVTMSVLLMLGLFGCDQSLQDMKDPSSGADSKSASSEDSDTDTASVPISDTSSMTDNSQSQDSGKNTSSTDDVIDVGDTQIGDVTGGDSAPVEVDTSVPSESEDPSGSEITVQEPETPAQPGTCDCAKVTMPNTPPFETGVRPLASVPEKTNIVNVSTTAALIDAINQASDEQTIVVAPGTYTPGSVTLAADSVTLMSDTGDGVTFAGDTQLILDGLNAHVFGITFFEGGTSSAEPGAAIVVNGDDAHIDRVTLLNWGANQDGWILGINVDRFANDVEISDCHFDHHKGIAIRQSKSWAADFVPGKRLWIHHNFFDTNVRVGPGGEALHLGTGYSSAQAEPGPAGADFDDRYRAVFEYNHVLHYEAEFELISLKSSQNTIRYNFMENNGKAAIVVRMGQENMIYSNWFTGVQYAAVRVSGERNIIAYNVASRGAEYVGKNANSGFVNLHNEHPYYDADFTGTRRDDLANAYWAANQTQVAHNIMSGFPSLISMNNSPSTSITSFPDGVRAQENVLISGSQFFFDGGVPDRATFLSTNNLVDNHLLDALGEMPDGTSLPIDQSFSIDSSGQALTPPTWLSSAVCQSCE